MLRSMLMQNNRNIEGRDPSNYGKPLFFQHNFILVMTTNSLFRFTIKVFLAACLFIAIAPAQEKPKLPETDRIRIVEAFRLADQVGDSVWSGWSKAPFAVLLVTPEYEFLIRHPEPSKDFTSLGYDEMLKSEVLFRKRVFAPNLLATFPAVGGISTIVIGQAENTNVKTPTAWVRTMLHEHFHQLQYSQPTYYAEVDSLHLSHGDQTGMWMLNYPFPYNSPEVNRQFTFLCQLLYDVLRSRETDGFRMKALKYMRARQGFKDLLSTDDYKYFSFQLWQEGVSRYTEYRIVRLAGERFTPSEKFRSLSEFMPFKDNADTTHQRIVNSLLTISLEKDNREVVYVFGAAEALLLDALDPEWQKNYFKEKFYLNKYWEK